jgi:hypothetical protein
VAQEKQFGAPAIEFSPDEILSPADAHAARIAGDIERQKKQLLKTVVWRRRGCGNGRLLNGEKQLPKVIEGVRFIDGIEVIEAQKQNAAW